MTGVADLLSQSLLVVTIEHAFSKTCKHENIKFQAHLELKLLPDHSK